MAINQNDQKPGISGKIHAKKLKNLLQHKPQSWFILWGSLNEIAKNSNMMKKGQHTYIWGQT